MSETNGADPGRSSEAAHEKAKQGIERAETGDASSIEKLKDAEAADPAGTEAAEQEAADGPKGRGLSR